MHRTSRNLRSLWDEYALQITAEGRERDSSRLLALTSFMESIFDVGQPLELSSLGTFNFDDTAVVITGLLNVARRASIQLLTEDMYKEEVDRSTLAEALKKALVVAKLCLKKCFNLEQINRIPHIVSLVLAILENVASTDDKILSLQIMGYLLRYEDSRQELRRLGGLELLCSLAPVPVPELRRQIVATLRLCFSRPVAAASASSHNRMGAAVAAASVGGTASGELAQSPAAVEPTCPPRSSVDYSSLDSDEHQALPSSSSSLVGGGVSSWPPLLPPPPLSSSAALLGAAAGAGAGGGSRCNSHSQDAAQPRTTALPPRTTTTHPSASLAAKGVNMAVNVVNEILRCGGLSLRLCS